MRAVELTTNQKPRREPPAKYPDMGVAVFGTLGIPTCIHIRKVAAIPFVIERDFVYCFDCHDLFLSWDEHHQTAAAA